MKLLSFDDCTSSSSLFRAKLLDAVEGEFSGDKWGRSLVGAWRNCGCRMRDWLGVTGAADIAEADGDTDEEGNNC